MKTITSQNEWQLVLEKSHAIVAIVPVWSAPARAALPVIEGLQSEWGNRHPEIEVAFCVIEESEDCHPFWQWMISLDREDLKMTAIGNGSVLWLLDGVVADWVLNARHTGLQELLNTTGKLFARSE